MRLRGIDIFSGKSVDVYATITIDRPVSSNGRLVLLVEGLYGEMIEMDHATIIPQINLAKFTWRPDF